MWLWLSVAVEEAKLDYDMQLYRQLAIQPLRVWFGVSIGLNTRAFLSFFFCWKKRIEKNTGFFVLRWIKNIFFVYFLVLSERETIHNVVIAIRCAILVFILFACDYSYSIIICFFGIYEQQQNHQTSYKKINNEQ